MVVSSRTPDGEPAICPNCGAVVQAEPSAFYADVPCASCGCLLWFVRLREQSLVVRPNDAARKKGLEKILAELIGLDERNLPLSSQSLDGLELDSMQVVELVMALEDESFDS